VRGVELGSSGEGRRVRVVELGSSS
jgi:hypothetical protein